MLLRQYLTGMNHIIGIVWQCFGW